jgi:hypothetical protein
LQTLSTLRNYSVRPGGFSPITTNATVGRLRPKGNNMLQIIVFVLVVLLMSVFSYYLGCIHTWKKAGSHLIKYAAQQGVQLTAAGVESDGENQDSGGN